MLESQLFPDIGEQLLQTLNVLPADEPETVLFKVLMHLCSAPQDAEVEWPKISENAENMFLNYQDLEVLRLLKQLIADGPLSAHIREQIISILA